jgi:hypothetical protein
MTNPNPASLAARIEQRINIPSGAVAPSFAAATPVAQADANDDRLVTYMVAARPVYDGLRRAAAQLAGVLVLATIGGKSGQDHPMIRLAEDTYREAADAMGSLRPPPSAAHHHRHLAAAGECLGEAFDSVSRRLHGAQAELDALHRPVAGAIDHLRWAGQMLPGFEIVDFSQGCACHPGIFNRTARIEKRIAR